MVEIELFSNLNQSGKIGEKLSVNQFEFRFFVFKQNQVNLVCNIIYSKLNQAKLSRFKAVPL